MYRIRSTPNAKVRLLGAGTILREAIAAANILDEEHGIAADVYSVTSFSELRREATSSDAQTGIAESCIQQQLPENGTPVVAASDYVRAVPDLIRPWIRDRYTTLGTDGFGRSDTRQACATSLTSIGDRSRAPRCSVSSEVLRELLETLTQIVPTRADVWSNNLASRSALNVVFNRCRIRRRQDHIRRSSDPPVWVARLHRRTRRWVERERYFACSSKHYESGLPIVVDVGARGAGRIREPAAWKKP